MGAKTITEPDFVSLLQKPVVTLPLPTGFNKNNEETEHLRGLWARTPRFQKYEFKEFIHAGGSGMVFRVTEHETGSDWAMKIARKRAFQAPQTGSTGTGSVQSPFSDTEISALEQVSHPNLVSLRDRIVDPSGVIVALVTTYVHRPRQLDDYLQYALAQEPTDRDITAFSPERLERASAFLVERCREIASALVHMHERNLFHCDVKPANILIGASRAVLTDLGSTIHYVPKQAGGERQLRVRFTWTYAHPELRDLGQEVRSISGGGLKVSVNVNPRRGLERFDLFAFGRTIQETLATLVTEFGERCYASYGFRFMHLVACLLLDGVNAPIRASERVAKHDGRYFVSDVALDYPVDLFEKHKIVTATDLLNRLNRFGREHSWNEEIPELDEWQPDYVNTGAGRAAPYTERVAALMDHPAVRRLRSELQLGWVRDVYPGATHTRWTHTLGVFANVADYFNALLADPELPTARILLTEADIENGLVSSILHDIGQTAFAHDLEAVNQTLFNHEALVPALLFDNHFGRQTLASVIAKKWPRVDLGRVLAILGLRELNLKSLASVKQEELSVLFRTSKIRGYVIELPQELPVDGLAKDMINGPIDADKLDYLIRDSLACGVHYGLGIDRARFLRSLTVHVKAGAAGKMARLALAYRAKGAAAIESLLLARYQLYGSVYWHHTFRCIQAMLVQAAANTFLTAKDTDPARDSGRSFDLEFVKKTYYEAVVCRRSVGKEAGARAPSAVNSEPALKFVWGLADKRNRQLIERIASRQLYKRAFEIRTSDIGRADYSALQMEFTPDKRGGVADTLEKYFLRSIERKIAERHGPTESASEAKARAIAKKLETIDLPLVVLDYPIVGIPDDKNIPIEIGDAYRKYISGPDDVPARGREVFNNVRRLQIEIATLRVFTEPSLHELIIRYLDPKEVRACVFEAIPFLLADR